VPRSVGITGSCHRRLDPYRKRPQILYLNSVLAHPERSFVAVASLSVHRWIMTPPSGLRVRDPVLGIANTCKN